LETFRLRRRSPLLYHWRQRFSFERRWFPGARATATPLVRLLGMTADAAWPALVVSFLLGLFAGRRSKHQRTGASGLDTSASGAPAGSVIDSTPADAPFASLVPLASAPSGTTADVKLMLIVRRDLKMSPGKIAAQCGHASVGAFRGCTDRALLAAWDRNGQPKIALRCSSLKELLAIERAARQLRIPTFAVRDAGRTQVVAGTITVLAVGPAESAKLQRITGHLKLL